MKNQNYTTEFKERAVKLVLEQGIKASQVAEELGVSNSYLSKWKKEYLMKRNNVKIDKPRTLDEASDRIKELENELIIAQEERDILKKAVGFFAKQ
jgi:transposase